MMILRSTTSLIHTFPEELLTEIFINYGAATPSVFLPPGRDLYPWRLGHVCSRWRGTLWNSSEIWETIEVFPSRTRTSDDETRILSILREIVSRTHGLVSLVIRSYNPSRAIELIQLVAHRCKRLSTASVEMHPILHTLLELPPGSLAHLQGLRVLYKDHSKTPLELHNTTQLVVPRLRSLTIQNFDSDTYILHFPLSQLTNLCLMGCMLSPTIVHFMLQKCTSLQSAEFVVTGEPEPEPTTRLEGEIPSTITSNLVTLRLKHRIDFKYGWKAFLGPLTLPSLKTIEVSGRVDFPAGLEPTLVCALDALITRSECVIEVFVVWNHAGTIFGLLHYEIDVSYIKGLLQRLPDLKTFQADDIAPPELIKAVHNEFIPRLETAHWNVGPSGFNALLDILDDYASQPSSQVPLRTLKISLFGGLGMLAASARFTVRYDVYKDLGIDIIVDGLA